MKLGLEASEVQWEVVLCGNERKSQPRPETEVTKAGTECVFSPLAVLHIRPVGSV